MNKHYRLTVVLGVFVLLLVGATQGKAQQRVPLNPEFLQYRQELRSKNAFRLTADGHSLGAIPEPFVLPQPTAAARGRMNKFEVLPYSYDLGAYGKISAVQDQGDYGVCWTFATFASLESCLLPGESWDFSENNLANYHGYDTGYGFGNRLKALGYLTRWSGPVNESADPYSNGPSGSPTGLPVQKHVQNALFIPDRASSNDNDLIKEAIMTYGAVYSTYRHHDNYYNENNYAYYYYGTNPLNHAIALVGWDDMYPATKFKVAPPGDGAFIAKNSWGRSWGNFGFFWISYHDVRIGRQNCVFYNAESTANYPSIYQYDTLGLTTPYGFDSEAAWGANIFSGSGGTIEAVSFYAVADGATYKIYVFTDGTADNPISGTLSAAATGSVTYAGYYTVPLDAPASYATRFAVVAKFITPDFTFPLPVEFPIEDYSSAATASAGESYLSADGTTWEEAKEDGVYFNVCLKAFGSGGETTPIPPQPTSEPSQPVLADFDSDRKADLALLDSDGIWHVLLSLNDYDPFSFSSIYKGSDFIAQGGDFDGDRYADPAAADASSGGQYSGFWRYYSSANGYQRYFIDQYWFDPDAAAVCGDFDGDGYADPTYVSGSEWYVLASSANYSSAYYLNWGGSGSTPTAADYDGDGLADPMLYEESTGNWLILMSYYGYIQRTIWFGAPGYSPVPGDFDGDRYADLVVYNKSSGRWYILLSSTGYNLNYYLTGVWDGRAQLTATGL